MTRHSSARSVAWRGVRPVKLITWSSHFVKIENLIAIGEASADIVNVVTACMYLYVLEGRFVSKFDAYKEFLGMEFD